MDKANGLGALWIVTTATPDSELVDIVFQADWHRMALQFAGGLNPADIIGWFNNASEANQIALQELHRASSAAHEESCSTGEKACSHHEYELGGSCTA